MQMPATKKISQAQGEKLVQDLLKELLESMAGYSSKKDLELIKRVFHFAKDAHEGQERLSGEPYLIHPLSVGIILAELNQDIPTVAAGLLHDVVEDTNSTHSSIADTFSPEIANLVDGVTKISRIKGMSRESNVAENIRKMLLATTKDARVMIIKLSDKLHNMKTLRYMNPEKQQRIATETIDIYASLAGRLGMYKIKSELEDLAFKILNPDTYQKVKDHVHETKSDRTQYIRKLIDKINRQLKKHSLKAQVKGRAKHYYSIFFKMEKNQKEFEEIFDLRGIRIITARHKDHNRKYHRLLFYFGSASFYVEAYSRTL